MTVVQPTQRWDGDVLSGTELRKTSPELESILTVPVTYRQTSEGTDRVRMLAQNRVLPVTQLQRPLCGFHAALRADQREEIGQIEQRTHLHIDQTVVGRSSSQGLVGFDGAHIENRHTMRGECGEQLQFRLRRPRLWQMAYQLQGPHEH